MEKAEFKSLLKEIRSELNMNKNLLDKVLNEEMCRGNSINLQKIANTIKEYENFEDFNHENKKIAVYYSGNPEITITYILDSIIYNNNITLCSKGHRRFNSILIDCIKEAFANRKLENKWINYDDSYNEVYLKDNSKLFDKLVYIGDYFEYMQFKSFVNREVEYNNFGSIKLFINQSEYKEEYKKIINYSTREKIFLEVYDDIQEFINESKDENFSVVFGDIDILKTARKELKGEMLFNAFPYDDYKFTISR
jgi:hypothetical protein